MYGAPFSSVPTSMTRQTCSLLQPRRGARLAQEALARSRRFASCRARQELDRDALVELEVRRGHDHAHAAVAEHALDPELARDDRAYLEHLRQHI